MKPILLSTLLLCGCTGFFTEPLYPTDRIMTVEERTEQYNVSLFDSKPECVFNEQGATNKPCRDLRRNMIEPSTQKIAQKELDKIKLPIVTVNFSTVSEAEVTCARITGVLDKGNYPQACNRTTPTAHYVYVTYGHYNAWNHEVRHHPELWGPNYHYWFDERSNRLRGPGTVALRDLFTD